ncbi:mitochondrial 2-oxoglutarate/malate carrier protein-like isoform X2 [Plodia interpunctella]|uniref:mitochondrial 2-oxoglutarate/malate carrier protein-like isoform X2 n=1 Tax=Plodia interpunctella TaxID=58824 RepID=UPI0023687426|nr:mitochondrial 2-oxoglutarate/malate carrier protein-like isoform X2 [Plodia interpunctella]
MAPKAKECPRPISDGVLAGMVATVVTHPLDVLKVRLQVSPARCTTLHLAILLVKYEGFRGLSCGLTAGLLRQATYTATRLSVYDMLYRNYMRDNARGPSRTDKLWFGIYSGLCGGLVGNPSELVLVRRIVEGCQRTPPPGVTCCRCPCSYFGTIDAFKKIICVDGFSGLLRGATLTLLRSVVLSTVYVGGYDRIIDYVKCQTKEKDPFIVRVSAAIAMSFIAAVLSSPIDVVKTFYQASRCDDETYKETLQYIIRCRGYRALWKGFAPYFTRMAIHTIVAFIVLDRLADNAVK